ncbi:MAG TPA: hypothetical protein VKG23_03225 [Thermoanaerobaculia bacterium]|nr:hypothetical protein [Thermoanaerobaculia bacterium]
MLAAKLVIFLGFAAVLAFVIVLLATQNSIETRLDCNRAAGTCTFTQRRMLHTSEFTVPIEGLGPASFRVSTGGRKGVVISVWLATPKGSAYFDDYLSRGEAQLDADHINRFLGTPSDPRLRILRNHRKIYRLAWVLAAAASAMIGVLGWVLFFRKEPAAVRA